MGEVGELIALLKAPHTHPPLTPHPWWTVLMQSPVEVLTVLRSVFPLCQSLSLKARGKRWRREKKQFSSKQQHKMHGKKPYSIHSPRRKLNNIQNTTARLCLSPDIIPNKIRSSRQWKRHKKHHLTTEISGLVSSGSWNAARNAVTISYMFNAWCVH